MDLSPHVAALRADLSGAGAVGSDEVARAAGLLGDAIEPALRLVLLDLLSEAAEELSGQLPGATVEVRLRGREPELVATLQAAAAPLPEPAGDDGTARLTLRLPEALKTRAEAAAAAESLSVNSWLVRAVQAALDPKPTFPFLGGPGGPRRLQGYGRA
ncbi:MAG: toxin-antitoxin system HicB family antitoxin [Mycobacteriales bacterium]